MFLWEGKGGWVLGMVNDGYRVIDVLCSDQTCKNDCTEVTEQHASWKNWWFLQR